MIEQKLIRWELGSFSATARLVVPMMLDLGGSLRPFGLILYSPDFWALLTESPSRHATRVSVLTRPGRWKSWWRSSSEV